MIGKDKAGFGEASEEGPTTTRNAHARVTTIPRDGGFDVVVGSVRGLRTEGGETTVTIRFREDHGPRIGERVMMAGRLVKVADKRFDNAGRIMVMDEDTHAWMPWEAGDAGRAGR